MAISPGFSPGISTQPVNKGGTGATTASGARSNLGLAASTTDNAICRFDGTAGSTQNSGCTIDDSGNLTVSGTGQHAFGPSFTPLNWGNASVDVNGTTGGLVAVYNNGQAEGYLAADTTSSILLQAQSNGTVKINTAGVGVVTLGNSGGGVDVPGRLRGESGYQFRGANNTGYELLRHISGGNNVGLYASIVDSTATARLEASGSSGAFNLQLGAGGTTAATFTSTATTLAGNLTVSGTQNTLGVPASANALTTNSTMTFELTSNTSLTIKVRGTDGTTRSVALTLA